MSHTIRILVADDHVVARVGMATIVNSQTDMTVVGEAANGRQAVDLYRKIRPDVALLDMRMPIMSGTEAAAAIRAEFIDAHLIALTTYGGDEDVRRALVSGVQVYVTKDAPPTELLRAIRAAYHGESYVFGTLASVGAEAKSPCLTPREIEVLELIVRGLANKQIAYALKMSDNTAKNHVKTILFKLGVQDRTQAATEAIRRGIIQL